MTAYSTEAKTRGLVNQPKWLSDSIHYECIMGSNAYGVSSDSSDLDLYGFAIPPAEIVFPHLSGAIIGFGQQPDKFEQWSQHHVRGWKTVNGSPQELDFSIYSIVKYFQLVMENNPNMIDSLFVPEECITHISPIGSMVRENRKMFLHKGSWHKFKGYAYSQLHKIKTSANATSPSRKASIEKYGYDVKFAYHVVRLVNEARQILEEQDLDLRRSREQLKAVRRGEFSLDEIHKWFKRQEEDLEDIYTKSSLPHRPNQKHIRDLLTECLEMHYGSLDGLFKVTQEQRLMRELKELVKKYE